MSKKSLLYIIIIICVLTSGFFLAGNYRSSIEMKNRGENIIPSVKDVEDIKQPQIEFHIDMNTSEFCSNQSESTPYRCGSGFNAYCCNAQQYCEDYNGGKLVGDECYTQQEYCEEIEGKVWHNNQCKTAQEACVDSGRVWDDDGQCRTQQESCVHYGNVWDDDGQCRTQQESCVYHGKVWDDDGQCRTQQESCVYHGKVWDEDGQCRTQQESCVHHGKVWDDDGQCRTQQESCVHHGKVWDEDGQCRTQQESCVHHGKYWNVNHCIDKNTDEYCLTVNGTHYSGGSCRTNEAECVYLEGNGAVYRGTSNEKYSPTKCDSVADQCSREGKVLYGGKCITHQQMCEDVRKGTWKNGTCVTNNNGGDGVSGKTSNKDKNDNPKTDDVIGTDATLTDIVLSSGRLMFDFGTSDYRVEVSSNVESITIEPITTDPDATFVVNGDTKLKPGDNVFTIVVTAEDGTTTRTYNLTIVRTDRILSSNSKASLIEIANHEINFDKDQTEYEVDLDKDESELDIKVTADDNLSITEVLGNEGLENGDVVTVKVTAEDGSYTVYAIKINKEVPFNIKDYIPYIVAGVAGLLLIVFGVAVLRGRKSNDEEASDEEDDKDKMKDDNEDKDDFKMKSKE